MVAERPNLTPMKFKAPRKTDTEIRRALVHYRPAATHLDDEGINALWDSLGPQTQSQYLAGYRDLNQRGKPSATTSPAGPKKKAKKKAKKKPTS